MTEADWLSSTDPEAMLSFLRDAGKLSERRARLFAVAACRRVWSLLTDGRSRRAVEVAEQYADGAIDYETLERACGGANKPRSLVRDLWWPEGWMVAEFVSFDAAAMADDMAGEGRAYFEEREAQSRLLREMCGNPFAASSIHTCRLKANGGRVLRLARSIYNERAFGRFPEVAQALEAAGCTDAAILAHCREPGEHVKGCWVLDALLGKE